MSTKRKFKLRKIKQRLFILELIILNFIFIKEYNYK